MGLEDALGAPGPLADPPQFKAHAKQIALCVAVGLCATVAKPAVAPLPMSNRCCSCHVNACTQVMPNVAATPVAVLTRNEAEQTRGEQVKSRGSALRIIHNKCHR